MQAGFQEDGLEAHHLVEYYSIGLLNWKYVCSKYTAPSIKIEETSNVKFMPQSQIQVWVTCLSNLQKSFGAK